MTDEKSVNDSSGRKSEGKMFQNIAPLIFLWVKSCFSKSWFGVMELQVCSRGGVDNLSIRPFGIIEYYLLLFL